MWRTILWLAAVSLVYGANQATQRPEQDPGHFFGLTNLWTIHLTLNHEDWLAMEPDDRRPGSLTMDFPWRRCTFSCDGQTLTNVAIRFKGNSSFNSTRGSLKRPFRLDFNRDHPGRVFRGIKNVSLNNNFNDATQFREALAYDAYRRAGLPSSRTAFARLSLTLNGARTNEFLGLYTLVEFVDTDFLKRHFGTRKGLLLKPERLPGLAYLGETWRSYTNRYDPKTEVSPDDASRLMALTRLIAEADDATFERELPTGLDLDNLLRYVAVTAVLANYDSFMGNGHNYYLFLPSDRGKACFIPWDLNEAFGGHPMVGARPAQAELSVLRPHAAPNRLLERVLTHPEWSTAYRQILTATIEDACEPGRLIALAKQLAQVVEPTVSAESTSARASFQRIALGLNQDPFSGQPRDHSSPRPATEAGPGFGPASSTRRETMPLNDWITLRAKHVADELSGKRTGSLARLQSVPGGPGGPQLQPPPDPTREHLFPPELVLENQEAISLTIEQRRAVEEALRQMRPRVVEQERRLRQETATFEGILGEDRASHERVVTQFDRVAEAEKQLRRTHLELLLAIKEALSADQQIKLNELKARISPNREGQLSGPRPPSSDGARDFRRPQQRIQHDD